MAAGFQTYMLESWAVWPALAAAYLCTRHPWLRKISHLALAGAVSLALSLGWIIVVALIPTSHRFFIGSVGSIGGFNGGDAVPTLTAFEKLVDDGALRYVLGSGSTGAAGSSRGGCFGSTGTGNTAATRTDRAVPTPPAPRSARGCWRTARPSATRRRRAFTNAAGDPQAVRAEHGRQPMRSTRAASRRIDSALPRSSIDSNRGGDTRRPLIATRSGP